MKSAKYYIGLTLLIVLLLLTLSYAWKLVTIIFMSKNVSVFGQLEMYKWVAVGIVAYIVLHGFLRKNITWFETFSHELTHIIVALLFMRKVTSFHAEENSGMVYTRGSAGGMVAPMSLAPYCLPIYTYALLALRCLINSQGLWIYDIAIGITLAFHTYCFVKQTGKYQTDINGYPLLFSYIYIYTARLINLCIFAVAFFPGYNVFTSFWRYLRTVIDIIL